MQWSQAHWVIVVAGWTQGDLRFLGHLIRQQYMHYETAKKYSPKKYCIFHYMHGCISCVYFYEVDILKEFSYFFFFRKLPKRFTLEKYVKSIKLYSWRSSKVHTVSVDSVSDSSTCTSPNFHLGVLSNKQGRSDFLVLSPGYNHMLGT